MKLSFLENRFLKTDKKKDPILWRLSKKLRSFKVFPLKLFYGDVLFEKQNLNV